MELLHYGVKGMRWGHHKSATKLNETRHIPEETRAEIRKGARRQAISTGLASYSIIWTLQKEKRKGVVLTWQEKNNYQLKWKNKNVSL